jgi:hypothetical protein
MAAPLSTCPVPTEQRPINEYKSLQESWFFGWSSTSTPTFLRCLGLLWGLCYLITAPIAASSFDPWDALGHFVLAASGGNAVLISFVLLRLYLGWLYVYRRLDCPTVDYEETGWYDGQSWTKPPEDLAQDRLIGIYQIRPILARLKYCFGTLGLACILASNLWNFL